MKHIYINLHISYWSTPRCTPTCYYYEAVDNEEADFHEISYEKALKLQWELMLAGAERTISSNPLKASLHDTYVALWTRH